MAAFKCSFIGVNFAVELKVIRSFKSFSTLFTLKWLLARVCYSVSLQLWWSLESFSTLTAFIPLLTLFLWWKGIRGCCFHFFHFWYNIASSTCYSATGISQVVSSRIKKSQISYLAALINNRITCRVARNLISILLHKQNFYKSNTNS